MTRRAIASVLFALPFMALRFAAPLLAAPPDYSGRWTLVDPAHPPSGMPDRLVVTQTGTHVTRTLRGAPMDAMFYKVVVERHYGDRVQIEQFDVGLIGGSGGSAGGVAASGVPVDAAYQKFSSRWDGDSLVLEQEHGLLRASTRVQQLSEQESWSFDAQGQLVVARTTRVDNGSPATAFLLYTREK